jgi:molecular chaperone DnaK
MGKVIGIDLGSTLSEVAVIESGNPVVVVNEEGSSTTPSIINLKENSPKVGGAAKRQMLVAPKETVNLIKRFMGGTYDEVKEAITHVQYDVINDNGLPRVSINGRKYSPEELSAMILMKMKKVAEDYLGDTVTDAVITVPAFFSDAAKSATKQSGELAGLNVLRIISEPTAALLASNIDQKKEGKYLVVDFGGSTTDFSVADVSDNVIEILSSYGDVYLGGSDIDKIVSDYFVTNFKNSNGIDITTDSMAMSRVIEAAEKAKIELSNSGSTEINLPYITVKDKQPVHLIETLTKAKFEQLIRPIADRVINCGKVALEKAKLNASDLDGILLVGGSCRIPLIQDELIKNFGDKLIKSANLDLAVAEGAAIQANILAGGKSDILLLDVTPLRLGIETMGGVMTTLVEANTTIPCSKEQIFSTATDNQTAVTINVLQGERPMAKDNKQIGLFNLDGIAPARRGIPQIKVKFDIDANGILSVSATDNATGKEQHITIENKHTLTQEEIDRIKREAEEHAAEDKKTKERLDKQNYIDSTIYQVENFVEDYKDKSDILTEEDKNYFKEKIEELKTIREGDLTNADNLITEVNQRLASVGSKVYGTQNNQNGNPFGQGNFDASQFADMFGGKNGQFNGSTNNGATTNAKTEDVEEV